eukprot:gene1411-biopygen2637
MKERGRKGRRRKGNEERKKEEGRNEEGKGGQKEEPDIICSGHDSRLTRAPAPRSGGGLRYVGRVEVDDDAVALKPLHGAAEAVEHRRPLQPVRLDDGP